MKFVGIYKAVNGSVVSFSLGDFASKKKKEGKAFFFKEFLQSLKDQRDKIYISYKNQQIPRSCFFHTQECPLDVLPLVILSESEFKHFVEEDFILYVEDMEDDFDSIRREVFPFTERGVKVQNILKEFKALDMEALSYYLQGKISDTKYLFLKQRMESLQKNMEILQQETLY